MASARKASAPNRKMFRMIQGLLSIKVTLGKTSTNTAGLLEPNRGLRDREMLNVTGLHGL